MADSFADPRPTFYEFFAGGGMVRAGLGPGWRCLAANDIDPGKAGCYRDNWGADDFHLGDIAALDPADLPGAPDLVWGSFPCQDLSLAGAGAGLDGQRSGAFYAFWKIVQGLDRQGRAPRLVVVENVCGALTSRGGRDFEAICRSFVDGGYTPGALVMNADRFLPQSRPRLFVVGLRADLPTTPSARSHPFGTLHTPALIRSVNRLPAALRRKVVWWRAPEPDGATVALADVLEPDRPGLRWHTAAQTARLIGMMSPVNRARLEAASRDGSLVSGTVFRRTRVERGRSVQRAEIRFDRAGCLRTPAGGSSRQIVLVTDGLETRSRLLTGREMARLMGLKDNYKLPASETAAARLCGDGVAVPVVRHLAHGLMEPLLREDLADRQAA